MNMLQGLANGLQSSLLGIGAYGILLSFAIIFIESIIPCMPLGLFITGIFYSYGNMYGFLICWIATILGCTVSYYLFNRVLSGFLDKVLLSKLNKRTVDKIDDIKSYIGNLSLSSLTLLVACPFTPAFVVNIAAGLTNVDDKKFILSMIIGKPFMIYFYGMIGTSLVDSFSNPYVFIKIGIMLLIAYGLSKLCDRLVKA